MWQRRALDGASKAHTVPTMAAKDEQPPDDGLVFDLGNLAAFDSRGFDEKLFKCVLWPRLPRSTHVQAAGIRRDG